METCKFIAMYHEVFRTGIFTLVAAGGLVGLCLAWRRVKVMEKQARTDADRLFDGRYQKGAEMMGHLYMHTRLGGVVVLADLAEDKEANYRTQVEKFFLTYMASPSMFSAKEYPDGHPKYRKVDYDSRETVEVVKKILEWRIDWETEAARVAQKHISETISGHEELAELAVRQAVSSS